MTKTINGKLPDGTYCQIGFVTPQEGADFQWVESVKGVDRAIYVEPDAQEGTEEYIREVLSGDREITTAANFQVSKTEDAISKDVYLSSFPFDEAIRNLRLLIKPLTVSISNPKSGKRTPEIPINELPEEVRRDILSILEIS